MPNVAQAISRHNKGLLPKSREEEPPLCDCPDPCPVGGQCKLKNVVYQAKVQVRNSQKFETYTGLTYRKFCTRLKEHCDDMKDPAKRTSSKLAGHVWDLKDRGIAFDISWSILAKAPPFNPVTRK